MIKQSIRLLFSTCRLSTQRSYPLFQNRRGLYFKRAQMFCQDKNKTPETEPPKEEQKQQEDPQAKKLSQLNTEELIELGTQQSFKMAVRNIEIIEKRNEEIKEKIKQNQDQLEFFKKHHEELADKQETLLENIKQQDAELDRVRKRMEKEVDDSKDYAIVKLAKQLVQIADNMKRCRQMAQKIITEESKSDPYLQKIVETHDLFIKFLNLYEIVQFDPINEPFDPNTSQSLLTIPCPPGYTVNNVATTMRTGYKIKDRLLRSARVGIFV